MRTRRIPTVTATATAFAVLFSSIVLVGGAASPAAADSSASLPVKSSGDIVVDGVHQRVFISDPRSGKIVATDYNGKVIRQIGSLPGVIGLELSPDSKTVYAAVPGAEAIAAIDTASLTETKRYPLGEGVTPKYPAVAGGKLWFGFDSPEPGQRGQIGSVDLSSPEETVTLGSGMEDGWYSAPRLAADPGAPNVLAAAQEGSSFITLSVYDVSTGTRTRVAHGPSTTGPTGGTQYQSYLSDFDITPDGKSVLVGGGGTPYAAQSYSTADLSRTNTLATNAGGRALAVAPDGTLALGSWQSPNVLVYKQGGKSPYRTYTFPAYDGTPSTSYDLREAGLAWAPDRSRVFAVTTNVYNDVFRLRTLTDASRSAVTVSVKAPSKATRAKKLTVNGRLTTNPALPAGARATVVRTDLESPKGRSLASVTPKKDGTFSFTDTPHVGGKVTYKVSYAGSGTHSPASRSATVDVSRAATSLKLNRNNSTHAYNKNVSFTASLGTTHKNRVVELWADPFGADKPKKLLKKAKVNSKGNLSVTVNMKRDTAVTAVFAGDARYAPKTVKSTAYAKVNVSVKLSKHYRTAKIGKTSYAYYSKKKNPDFTTSMTYYKGRAQRLTLQFNYQGRWYDLGQEYFPLASDGKSVVTLPGPHETGYKMRVRASYVNGSSGDSVNSTTHSAWKYFIFTK
ncbi:Ig-like domain repeat protein [Streptomyces rhizosphaericola]|uniref:Ig-like domain repeat protein n=1 Tax=Streptomyces rhizosphaericola TaxID=2564098 RepID=A0ABY2P8U2_9ACTN|nr:Ig-like domain repeat protein [Streptomyces rhizosphaericola]